MNQEKRKCIICHLLKPLTMFNERPDGSGLKSVCKICEMRRKSEFKARGVRSCHDCGKPTVNFRCEQCWRELCGVSPLKARVDGNSNEVLL